MIRVLIADDHELIRLALTDILAAESDMEVCGVAETGEAAVELAHRCSPDVVVLDLTMPGAGGIEATARIRRTEPQVRVMVVSLHDDDAHVRGALAAGAIGYILKDTGASQVVDAVRAVHRGEICLSPDAARALGPRPAADVNGRASPRARVLRRPRKGPWRRW